MKCGLCLFPSGDILIGANTNTAVFVYPMLKATTTASMGDTNRMTTLQVRIQNLSTKHEIFMRTKVMSKSKSAL